MRSTITAASFFGIASRVQTLFSLVVPKLRTIIIVWLPVVLWMALIFQASSDRLSWEHSSRFVEPLVRWLFPAASDQAVRAAVLFTRKCAHVTEFAILTLLVWRALRHSAATPGAQWSWRTAFLALSIVSVFAASDELHQSLVPSRQGSVLDVLVDLAGALLGLLFLSALTGWRRIGNSGV